MNTKHILLVHDDERAENRATDSDLLSQLLAHALRVLDWRPMGGTSGGDARPMPERTAEPNYTRGFVVRQFE